MTSTFEYPSETSLLIDETFGNDDEVDANFYGRSGSSKLLTSVPLGKFPSLTYGHHGFSLYFNIFFKVQRLLQITNHKKQLQDRLNWELLEQRHRHHQHLQKKILLLVTQMKMSQII